MGIRSFFKSTIKDNTNVKGWLIWDNIAKNAKVVSSLAKDIKPSSRMEETLAAPESFQQAVQRLGLSEAQLTSKKRTYFLTALFCAVLAIVALLWSVRLLWVGMFLSSLVGISLGGLMVGYAYYNHLNYCRIKYRTLKLGFSAWIAILLGRANR